MAVRAFSGSGASSSRILFSPGTIPGALDAAWSVLFVARNMGGANFKTFLSFGSAGGPLLEYYLHGADSIGYEDGGGENYTPSPVMPASKNWCVVGFTKISGSAAVRGHVYDYQTNTAVHEDTSGSLGNIVTAITGVYLGYSERYDYSSLANPVRYGAAAILEGTALSDAAFEGLTTRYQSWLDLSPASAWRLNQTSTATAVVDDTGGGADQSSTSNTTVVLTDDPPGWDPELSPTGIHRVDVRGLANPAVSGTTSTAVDLPAGGSIATGNYLIAKLALDNSGTNGAAVTLGVTDPRSNTWTIAGPANQDPGAANAGVTCYMAYARVDNAYSDGDDVTFNYGGVSTPAKAIVVEEWTGIDTTTPIVVAVTTATGSGTSPSIARTPTAADQLVLTALAVEGPATDVITQDDDTTDGTWQVLSKLGTTNATATNNVTIHGAAKQVSGTSAQTWNPTLGTSRDWAALALVLAPASTAVEVAADGTSHGHAADEPTLIQTHELVSADAAHGHAADEPALTQVHVLSVHSATHGHTADSPALAQVHSVAVDSTAHGQAAAQPAVTQVHVLATDDAAHGHAAGEPVLAQVHQVATDDSSHGHAADEPGVTQTHALVSVDASHAHAAQQPALTQLHELSPVDASHPHTVGEPALTGAGDLLVDSTVHGHTADDAGLTQIHQLAAEGAAHQQTAGEPALTQVHALAPADTSHGHTADEATLSTGLVLTVHSASHGHDAGQSFLTQLHQPVVAATIHGHTADQPVLTSVGGTTIPPPDTGLILRPDTGTVTKPDTGLVLQPSRTWP